MAPRPRVEADVIEEIARVRGYELHPADPARTRRCRPTGTARSRSRDAIRETLAGAGLSEVVTLRARRRRAWSSASRAATTALPTASRSSDRRAAGRRHQPALEPALGPAPEPARQPARGGRDQPPPRARRGGDLRDRQGLWRDRRRADPRVVAARVRADGPAEPPAWNQPAARLRPRRREGHPRARWPGGSACRRRRTTPLDRRSEPAPGPCGPGRRRRTAHRGPGRASCIRPSSTRSSSGPSGSSWPRSPSAGSPAGSSPPHGSTPPSRHPAVERDLAVIVAATTGPPPTSRPSIRRHAGPRLRAVALFDIYRGKPLADDEQEPRLPADVARRRPDAHGGRGRRRGRRVTAGLAADLGARLRT